MRGHEGRGGPGGIMPAHQQCTDTTLAPSSMAPPPQPPTPTPLPRGARPSGPPQPPPDPPPVFPPKLHGGKQMPPAPPLLIFSLQPPMLQLLHQFLTHLSGQAQTPISPCPTLPTAIQQLSSLQFIAPKVFAQNVSSLLYLLEHYGSQAEPMDTVGVYEVVAQNVEDEAAGYAGGGECVRVMGLLVGQAARVIKPGVEGCWFMDEDTPEVKLLTRLCDCVARISEAIDFGSTTIGHFHHSLAQMYNQPHLQAATMLCLGQLWDLGKFQKLTNIIKLMHIGLTNTDPQVRFYAVHAVTAFSNSLRPEFQDKYYHQFMPLIVQAIRQQQMQKLLAQWLHCLSKFIELDLTTININQYLQSILTTLCTHLQSTALTDTTLTCAIDCIASLASISRLLTPQRMDRLMQICSFMVSTYPSSRPALTPVSMSCLTACLAYCDHVLAQKYLPYCGDSLLHHASTLPNALLFDCWQNLCRTGVKYEHWLQLFMPIIQRIRSEQGCDMGCVGSTIECYGQQLGGYACQLLDYVYGRLRVAVEEEDGEHVEAMSLVMEKIMVMNKGGAGEKYNAKVRDILEDHLQYLKRVQPESALEVVVQVMGNVKVIAQNYGPILGAPAAQTAATTIWALVQHFDKQRQLQSAVLQQLDQAPSQQNNNQWQDIDIADQCSSSSSCSSSSLSLLDRCRLTLPLMLHHILPLLAQPQPHLTRILALLHPRADDDLNNTHYSIMFMCILVQLYPYAELHQHYPVFLAHLYKYGTAELVTLRQTVVYCIGVMVEKGEVIHNGQEMQELIAWIDKIYNMNGEGEQWLSCRDNCISSIGKIINKYWRHYDTGYVHQHWLGNLPLLHDHQQSQTQIGILARMVKDGAFQHNGNDSKQRIVLILKVVANLKWEVDRLARNRDWLRVLREAAGVLAAVLQWEGFRGDQAGVLAGLAEGEKEGLGMLMSYQ